MSNEMERIGQPSKWPNEWICDWVTHLREFCAALGEPSLLELPLEMNATIFEHMKHDVQRFRMTLLVHNFDAIRYVISALRDIGTFQGISKKIPGLLKQVGRRS